MTIRRCARFLLVLTIGLVALAPLTGHPVMVAAANVTFTVNSTVDAPDAHPGDGICADAAGQCTLRAAIQEADAQPSGSRIAINVPAGTYGLTLGTLQLTANNISISGALSSTTIISGNNTSAIMAISPTVQARLSQLTITGGNAGAGSGGGIVNQGVTVLAHSTLKSNTASFGGGIYNDVLGALRVSASTLSINTAPGGGGIGNNGALSVTASTFSGNYGGAIYNNSTLALTASILSGNNGNGIDNNGTVTVTTSILSGNGAGEGGGIYNNSGSTLTMRESTISGNSAYEGGGIINFGVMSIAASTVSGNIAQYSSASRGGGIWNGGRLHVTGSTLSGNAVASGYGGGIYNIATVSVSNSTLNSNSATYGGSAAWNDGGLITLSYDTIASNVDGLHNAYGTVALTGAIVANSTSGPNCSGSITDHGYNLDSGTSCGFSRSTDISNTNPLLGPLANNGGPTQTMALLPGSPAIDEGGTHATGCPATDQRGMPRPDEPKDKGACDMGAYESQGVG